MNFSEWTKNKNRKNQQVDLQETTKETSAATAAKASSFAEWTKNQTAAKSAQTGQSRNAGPQSFSEWIRQNRGDSAWREEDVAVQQRNDYISDYTQRANREFSAQLNRYVAPETAAQWQTEAASQAKAAKNAGTEILKAMRQSGRYTDEETRQALERLTAGDDVMEAVRKIAENDTAFRSQFQTEDQYNSWKKLQEYENLRNNPDFAEKSRYKSTANNSKPSVIDILADNYRADNSGWDDPLYEYVNGNQEAGAYLYNRANSIYGSGGNALGALYGNVADSKTEAVQITDDERALFNYIYATQGKDSAHEYYEAIQSGLNARQREQDMRALQEYAGERPVEASFLSVLESPLKGLSYIGQASDYLSGGSIDQNAGYNRFAYYGSSIRGKVSDTIENSGKWGKVGSFLYQTGMSMGDFLLNTALTGGFAVDGAAAPALAKGVEALSLAIMGTGAAADATIEAKDRGLTDTQAFTLGTIAGAAEIVTEKVSLETLLDKTTLGRDAVGYLLKNTLAEGSEEVASDLINLIADILVTKDKSQWHEAIQGYEAQGLSEKDAWWRAVLDQAEEMGVDFLGGALSGGVMAGAGIAINSGVNDYYARQNGRMILDADAVQDTIDSGLTMGKNTRAYQQARDLMARVSEGQDVSALQIGRLYGENVQALDAETKAGDLLLQAAREAAEHGTISNNRALDILDNSAALDTLISETGVEIREDMTRAQQRRAVKSAVEALASETTDISVPGNEPVTVNAESRQEAATAPVQAATENRNPALQVFDGKQIAEAGKALGENGRKALTSTYAKASDAMSGADYYEAFSQYYQAGVTGKTIAEVNSQVEISPAQQFAAYVSGQNDAAVAAAREKVAAKYAKTAGDGSGLVYDAFVKEAVESGRTLENSRSAYLTAETAERINDVAKALGLRAQFVDSVEGGLANAQIQGDTVLIERNNPNPVMFLTGHEITHRIQELAPEQYRSFRQFISENDADFQAQVEATQSLYESHGMEISYEKAMDEAAADYAGRLMEDGTLLDEFIQKNRKDKTLLEKVRDAIRSIIDVLTGREKQQAQTAEGKLTAALEAAAREAESISQRTENAAQEGEKNTAMSGGKKYSIAKRYEDVDLSNAGNVYTYDFLTSLPDMKVVTLPEIGSLRGSDNRIDTGAVVRSGMENARAVGTVQGGKTYVQNRYTGHNLRIDNSSVRHGLNGGQNRLLTNSRLAAVIGDVVKNAVPINALHNKADGVVGTYAMAGYAVDSSGREFVSIVTVEQRSGEITGVESYDVTHAVSGRQKNSSQADTKSQGVYPIKAANTSIDSLIQNVNSTHQSILSDDVLKHLGETRNPNGDYTNRVKFSLKSPVEETKDLVALHNVSEQGLLGAIDLGGLPSPSIAITKSEMGHTKYGPISLVFSKDTVDPQLFRSNKVYGSDAWTPTAPAVEYPVNSKKLTAVEQEFHKLAKNTDVAGGIFGNSSSIRGMGVDDISTKSTADLAKALAQTDTIRAAYLADQGKTLEPVKKTRVWDRYGNDPLRSFVDQVGPQRLAKMVVALELGENSQTALGQDAKTLDGILRDYYKQSGEAMLQRMAVRKKWTAQEIKEQRQARIDRAMENVTTFAKEDFIRHAWEMYQDGGATKGEIDRLATSDALRAAVNDSDVEAWAAEKLDGLLGEPGIYNGKDRYTASGNTRTFKQTHYDYTLENIVKAMKENQQAKGEGIWGASAGSLMAVATPEYGSIDEIRADKGRIRSASEEEYNRIKDQLRKQIDQVILGIRKTNRAMTDNQFEEIDHIGSALIDGAKGKQTPAAIRKAFQEYGYTVADNLIAPIQRLYKAAADTPTEYFEAKPQRAVGFDEVLAAVVPDNASEKLVEALGDKGVRVIPYEAGNDTDRIQKVNSVEGAKFSLKGTAIDKKYADLVKENRMLRERLDYWKGQTKLTKEVSIDKKAVERAAKGLLKTYESDMELFDVQGRLQSLYDYIARGYDGKDATYKEARRRAEALATDLIDNAVSRDTDMYDQYADLRQYLRDTKIVYGSEYKGDIPDFNDFRKRNFGRMRLSTEGKTNIDQVYQEMGSLWPEFFDEEAQAHPTDQLLRIDEVLSQLYEIHEGNPFSQYRTEAIADATNEIMETFFDLPQSKPTFADKQAAKIAELRAQNRQNVKDAILAETMAQGKEIAKLKRQYSEKSARTKESQTARELRGKITRHANSLSQKLLRPTDTQHIPENLRGAVAKLLASINQESAAGARTFTADPVTKERVYAPKGTPTKRTEAFRELKEQYARIAAEGGDVVVDPSLFGDEGEGIKGGFDAVIAMGDEKLSDMSAAQLKAVWQVLKAVEHSVTNAGKMLSATKYESTQKWADAFAKDASARRPRSQRLRNLGLSLETPYTYFSQYGETGKALYRALRNAQDQQQIIVSHITEDVQKVVDIEDEIRDAHTYAQLAVEYKEREPEMAELFYRLSQEEMSHMSMLHKEAVKLIENYRRENGQPPENMMAVYEYLHKRHMCEAEKVGVVQGLYKR